MGRGRLGLSTLDKRDIWSRWKAGETLHEIGRAYGKCHNTIRAVLLPRGGIPPLARRRSRLALTFAEREALGIDQRLPEISALGGIACSAFCLASSRIASASKRARFLRKSRPDRVVG